MPAGPSRSTRPARRTHTSRRGATRGKSCSRREACVRNGDARHDHLLIHHGVKRERSEARSIAASGFQAIFRDGHERSGHKRVNTSLTPRAHIALSRTNQGGRHV